MQISTATRSTEFASKKESNNLIVTGVTYKLYLDIKSLSIPISASPFSCHNYVLVSFIIAACIFSLSWALSKYLEVYQEDYFKINACSNLVVVAWEDFTQSLFIKATGASHGEWWVGRLAGRSISLTLEDVNISFNHLLYYSMSRGDGKVVTDKRWAW